MSRTSETLLAIYQAMLDRFGHQAWWPGQTPLEICVGAILTQNTSWTNVVKAIANLKAAGRLDIEALHSLSQEQLAELIRPAGYFNIKSRRLKNFVGMVHQRFAGRLENLLALPAERLRETLLEVSGIGRETADSMVLYAAGKPSFVVDAYTFRVLLRHGLIGPDDDYESVRELMQSHLPQDVALWNDYHAQLVAVGKNYCKPTPRCAGCPLEGFPHDVMAGCE